MDNIVVLDTSVLVSDSHSLFSFPKQGVYIPMTVINELDGLKKRSDDVGRNAREVIKTLELLSKDGSLSKGIKLENKSVLKIVPEEKTKDKDAKNDDAIINAAVAVKKKTGVEPVLVTQDLNMRVKARVLGLTATAFDYVEDREITEDLYSGVMELLLSPDDIEEFYMNDKITVDERENLYPNQIVIMKANNGSKSSAIGIHKGKGFIQRINEYKKVCGIKPKNKEQQFALQLLMNEDVQLVTLFGNAGTGKTLIALAAALQQLEDGVYDRIIITKPMVPVGRDIGFLPGSKEEKLAPWMGSIDDNLRFLLDDREYDKLMAENKIVFEALSLFRGRSLPHSFILVDESQNTNKVEAKTIVTRAGEGSKVVMTADVDQIDNPYVDSMTNGASHVVEKLKIEPLVGHITLIKGERSALATMAAKVL